MRDLNILQFVVVISFIIVVKQCETITECRKEETGDVSGNVSTTGLPNIDTEAAYEYMEPGECLGGEIPEKQFTIFICKEEK